MNEARIDRLVLNGREPGKDELAFLAQVNYGHFTTLQVRNRGARGLALHLQRLATATHELFGSELDVAQVREQLRALLSDAPCSVRMTVFSRALDRAQLELPVAADVLIATSAARSVRTTPLRLRSVVHERVLPSVKHIGTFDLYHAWRQARLAGFDDAVFRTPAGEVSEGTTWNIGFWDGAKVVWPVAPALPGVTRQLLDAGLRSQGITTACRSVLLADLPAFPTCFILNSGGVGPLVQSIDETRFVVDADLQRLLESAYLSQPVEII